mgnify:CR=1 FL=1
MNETMKNTRVVDHTRTESILKEILNGVRRQGSAYMSYQKRKDDSKDQAMYSAQYLQGFADEALENLVKIGKENLTKFDKLMEEAKQVEAANDRVLYDLKDNVMQNALTTINILGKDLDMQTCSDIIESFRGQKRALDIIRKTLEVKGIQISDKEKKYFYNSREVLELLEEKLVDLTINPKNISNYGMVLNEIKRVAVVLGIELTDKDLEISVPIDDIQNAQMRAAMGL